VRKKGEAVTDARYCIRYRLDTQRGTALVVEDTAGDAYVFGREGFVCRLTGSASLADYALTLLRLGWTPVPKVAPYSHEGLAMLLGSIAA